MSSGVMVLIYPRKRSILKNVLNIKIQIQLNLYVIVKS